jgi:hypothetical protein
MAQALPGSRSLVWEHTGTWVDRRALNLQREGGGAMRRGVK